MGERIRSRVYEQQGLLSFGLVEHGPTLIDRAAWAAMQADAAAEVAELQRHRFRQPHDLRPDRLYRWHLLTHARDRAVAEPCWRYLRYAAFHKIRRGADAQRRALTRLAARRPKFICLNDDLGPGGDPAVVAVVREFLGGMYPQASSFELT